MLINILLIEKIKHKLVCLIFISSYLKIILVLKALRLYFALIMKVVDYIKGRNKTIFSFEIIPPLKGKGIEEKGYLNNICIIECSKKYFRPAEVETLIGDSTKAKKILKWKPKHDIHSLVEDMISYELKSLE